MSVVDLQALMDRLTPACVMEIPFRDFELVRRSLIEVAKREFRKYESRLEELSKIVEVESKEALHQEKMYAFAKMEEQILILRLFGLDVDAYILASKYAKICQQYGSTAIIQSA